MMEIFLNIAKRFLVILLIYSNINVSFSHLLKIEELYFLKIFKMQCHFYNCYRIFVFSKTSSRFQLLLSLSL